MVGICLSAGPKSGSVATQSTCFRPIFWDSFATSPCKTLNSAFFNEYSFFNHWRLRLVASTHHLFISTPIVFALDNSASWRIVPTPQNGSKSVFPSVQAARLIMILASLGEIAKILRWTGLPTSRFWNSNGLWTADVVATNVCSLSIHSSISALSWSRHCVL